MEYWMDKDKMDYFRRGQIFIIIQEITKDIIEEALKTYKEDKDRYT